MEFTPLRPSLLSEDSLSKLTRSDIALSVTLSPRANELAVHTSLFSERIVKGQGPVKSEAKTPSLPNQDTVWLAKWGSTPRSAVSFYAEAYVTFKHLQLSVLQREQEGIPFESSQNIELLHGYTELYIGNVQTHVDRLATEEPFDAPSYVHWTSVSATLHLFQTLLTPQSGLLTGLIGEELLLWLNMNFVAPTTEEGRLYANKEKPWLEDGFWKYLIRSTIRGLSKGAMHFFTNLSKHPSPILRHIALLLPKTLDAHPRATNFTTEQEFFSAHRRWRESVRVLRNELEMLDDAEGRGDWREGLEDLVGVLEGRQDVIMRVCAEDTGGHGWREVLCVWGLWVRVDFRRQDLPDTLAVIIDTVPLDATMGDEKAQAALVSQQLKRFVQRSADLDPWLGAHVADLMEKMDMILYDTPITDEEDEMEEPFAEGEDAPLRLRDYLFMDYAGQILHSDPGLWLIEFDYLAACGEVGRARLGAVLRRLAVDVSEESPVTEKGEKVNGVLNGLVGAAGEDEENEEETAGLGKLTGMQRVQKLVNVCTEYELWDEYQSLCKVVAGLLVQQRRYGDAVPYCIHAEDYKTILRIVDLLLNEYIYEGAGEFIALVDTFPDVSDVLLNSPSFDLGGATSSSVTIFRNRLSFLEQYATFHKLFRDGKKREAAKTLMLMLNSEIVPQWWWGVILMDAAGMCDGEELWFEERDAYDLMRHIEEIYIRAEQGCGADYLGALEKMMRVAEEKNGKKSGTDKQAPQPSGGTAIKQLEVVRLSLARYLARSFTIQGGLRA